ncbi:hypothetical protein Hdeb2414_s0004g00139371 [Helianthus debilis subsp. tardiflorus]
MSVDPDVVRFLSMDLLSESAGVVMDRGSWILAILIMNYVFLND